MNDVDKIVALLRSDAVERRIAAAIVLGELRPKSAEAALALGAALEAGIPLLQLHALESLARIGAKRALARIFPLLSSNDADVRRAAAKAIASVGEEVVPEIKSRMQTATPDERRTLDAVLAELGGKDAFSALIRGLASENADAAKAAALAVRAEVKGADGQRRRSYLAAIEKFLTSQKQKGKEAFGAIAAAIKILGYLEDERTIATLLPYVEDENAHPQVRQEAIIAFRFALQKTKPSARVVDALLAAASADDRTLAQTALHTLASLSLGDDVVKRLEKITGHKDIDRARFVIEHLGRLGGQEACRVLAKALVTLPKPYADAAATALGGKEEAAAPLARALLDLADRDRAWLVRNVIRPVAKKVPPPVRKELLALAMDRLGKGEPGWEAQLDVVRDADPATAADALRELAARLRKAKNADKALTVLRLLGRTDRVTPQDRLDLAILELHRSVKDTRKEMRASDEALRALGQILQKGGLDVGKALRQDRSLSMDELYYVGFHFAEEGHALGEELLAEVVKKGGRTKIAKMARNKLALAEKTY